MWRCVQDHRCAGRNTAPNATGALTRLTGSDVSASLALHCGAAISSRPHEHDETRWSCTSPARPARTPPWEPLLADNIQASYRVAAAAPRAGSRRLIVASSAPAVYARPTRPVGVDDPVAPANLYGVTQCFVEALAFLCAHRGAMSAAAVRIGGFQTVEAVRAPVAADWMGDTFIAVSDLLELRELAITGRVLVRPAPRRCPRTQGAAQHQGHRGADGLARQRGRAAFLRRPTRGCWPERPRAEGTPRCPARSPVDRSPPGRKAHAARSTPARLTDVPIRAGLRVGDMPAPPTRRVGVPGDREGRATGRPGAWRHSGPPAAGRLPG